MTSNISVDNIACVSFHPIEHPSQWLILTFVQPCEINSRKGSTDLAHVWNKAVDETLGQLVVYLSSRGW
jgi:hypothetical protein